MRKLTPSVVAKIKALKIQGMTNREIATKLGLSTGAVSQAGRTVLGAPKAQASSGPPPTPPAPVSGDPVTTDELRSMLSKLARGLVADAEKARDDSQAEAYKSHARQAMNAVSALAKLTPAGRDEELEGAVLVTENSIAEAVDRAREKFRRTIAAIRRERSEWPKCAACGQAVRPG